MPTWIEMDCLECDGVGYFIDPPDGASDCKECEGTGRVEIGKELYNLMSEEYEDD